MFGFGKGKIEIKLEKYNFKPGDVIKGKVSLKMNKPTKAKGLRVAFEGIKISSERNAMGFGSSSKANTTRTETIHKFEMPLDGEKEYTQGEYDFEITVPENIFQGIPSSGINFGAAGNAIKLSLGGLARIQWFVQASLDIEKSLDVNKKVQINIG